MRRLLSNKRTLELILELCILRNTIHSARHHNQLEIDHSIIALITAVGKNEHLSWWDENALVYFLKKHFDVDHPVWNYLEVKETTNYGPGAETGMHKAFRIADEVVVIPFVSHISSSPGNERCELARDVRLRDYDRNARRVNIYRNAHDNEAWGYSKVTGRGMHNGGTETFQGAYHARIKDVITDSVAFIVGRDPKDKEVKRGAARILKFLGWTDKARLRKKKDDVKIPRA